MKFLIVYFKGRGTSLQRGSLYFRLTKSLKEIFEQNQTRLHHYSYEKSACSETKNHKRLKKTHTIRYTKNWFTHLKIYIYNGALTKKTTLTYFASKSIL
jgi:hypothetical protein